MNEREKYRAEIEAKLNRFDTTMGKLSGKERMREESRPDIRLEDLAEKRKQVEKMLEELDTVTDEDVYQRKKAELMRMMSDIDENLRQAQAYLMF